MKVHWVRTFAAAATAGCAMVVGGQGEAADSPAAAKAAAQPGPPAVSRATFIATMNGEFAKMDANKDGIVTRKEIEDYQRAAAKLEEQALQQHLFAALDTDHNGVISPQEFSKLVLPVPPVNAAPVLAQADLNHDGKITLVEYRTAKLKNFDAMDTDKDGVVTPAEMKAAGLIK